MTQNFSVFQPETHSVYTCMLSDGAADSIKAEHVYNIEAKRARDTHCCRVFKARSIVVHMAGIAWVGGSVVCTCLISSIM